MRDPLAAFGHRPRHRPWLVATTHARHITPLLMAISPAAAVVLDLPVSKKVQFGELFCDGQTFR